VQEETEDVEAGEDRTENGLMLLDYWWIVLIVVVAAIGAAVYLLVTRK
jgi:hypothetical protein